MSWWIIAWYIAASTVGFAAMCLDKSRARSSQRRIPERTLHLIELLGGWPGVVVAMLMTRHKARKWSYYTLTGIIAALHISLTLAILRR